ncbi:MAG UNVERIFIED_CONTAM: hypothetical protein LVQ98_06440 [Rickettsiaceae bacterium]|jgi:hypothetical protein
MRKRKPCFGDMLEKRVIRSRKNGFKELAGGRKSHVMFTAESDTQEILGFIIGKLMPAPGNFRIQEDSLLLIDDFWRAIRKPLAICWASVN